MTSQPEDLGGGLQLTDVEVPEADAQEQARDLVDADVDPEAVAGRTADLDDRPLEVNEADVAEQLSEAVVDDDDLDR